MLLIREDKIVLEINEQMFKYIEGINRRDYNIYLIL